MISANALQEIVVMTKIVDNPTFVSFLVNLESQLDIRRSLKITLKKDHSKNSYYRHCPTPSILLMSAKILKNFRDPDDVPYDHLNLIICYLCKCQHLHILKKSVHNLLDYVANKFINTQ